MRCFCHNLMEKKLINNMEFYHCSNCGYLKKINIPTLEQEKSRYDLHICDEGYQKYMNCVFNKVKPYLINGESLDFGCGKIHLLSDILNDNGFSCSYYDLFYYNDLKLKKYDNIILIEVFEHINDTYDLIKKLLSMLSENGRIIVMTKLIPKDLNNWWYLRDITHVSFVGIKSIQALAKAFNLKAIIDENNSLFVLSRI